MSLLNFQSSAGACALKAPPDARRLAMKGCVFVSIAMWQLQLKYRRETRLGGIQLASCQSKGAAGPITSLRGIKNTFSQDASPPNQRFRLPAHSRTHSRSDERKNAGSLRANKMKTPEPRGRVTRVGAALLLMHFKLNRKTFPSCAQREPWRENKISLSGTGWRNF